MAPPQRAGETLLSPWNMIHHSFNPPATGPGVNAAAFLNPGPGPGPNSGTFEGSHRDDGGSTSGSTPHQRFPFSFEDLLAEGLGDDALMTVPLSGKKHVEVITASTAAAAGSGGSGSGGGGGAAAAAGWRAGWKVVVLLLLLLIPRRWCGRRGARRAASCTSASKMTPCRRETHFQRSPTASQLEERRRRRESM